jgi:lipoprotein-anchoring transpeptidase ErfK/SrfK
VTETPHGRFRISFKHITDDMTGTVGDNAEVYSVSDVPWVQYIFQNVALHGAFWHSKFGAPKSHGCINLSPADARYLFDWTDPVLPKGWHGVAPVEGGPTTLVIIEGKTPEV